MDREKTAEDDQKDLAARLLDIVGRLGDYVKSQQRVTRDMIREREGARATVRRLALERNNLIKNYVGGGMERVDVDDEIQATSRITPMDDAGRLLFGFKAPSIVKKSVEEAGGKIDENSTAKLPDGSGCCTASFPLPKDHWLYDREADAHPQPSELLPLLRWRGTDLERKVSRAVKSAIRGATDHGRVMDFDPDALVQNLMYNLFGPARNPVSPVTEKAEKSPQTRDDCRSKTPDVSFKCGFCMHRGACWPALKNDLANELPADAADCRSRVSPSPVSGTSVQCETCGYKFVCWPEKQENRVPGPRSGVTRDLCRATYDEPTHHCSPCMQRSVCWPVRTYGESCDWVCEDCLNEDECWRGWEE
jgi:hypothetical protein